MNANEVISEFPRLAANFRFPLLLLLLVLFRQNAGIEFLSSLYHVMDDSGQFMGGATVFCRR